MHEVVPSDGGMRRIAFLNPGSNHRQESVLRLANGGDDDASITVRAIDDAGRAGGSPITLDLPAGQAAAFTAKALEDGSDGLSGSTGDGRGKWRLCVEADRPVTAMSLLETPTRHLTNLSGSPDLAECSAGMPGASRAADWPTAAVDRRRAGLRASAASSRHRHCRPPEASPEARQGRA